MVDWPARKARIEKRPMWLVCQVALKEPSLATVARTVSAHCQLVWWPRRWISTVCAGVVWPALPVKLSWLRSIVEAWLTSVMPSPVRADGDVAVLGAVDAGCWVARRWWSDCWSSSRMRWTRNRSAGRWRHVAARADRGQGERAHQEREHGIGIGAASIQFRSILLVAAYGVS